MIFSKKKNPGNYLFPGKKRRRPDLNRWILVLQTIALPLGYDAIRLRRESNPCYRRERAMS